MLFNCVTIAKPLQPLLSPSRPLQMNVDPEDLIPHMPRPRDLQPFPTTQSLVFRGHTAAVRCISVSPSGQWLVSGADDGTVRFWEVNTGRCLKTITLCKGQLTDVCPCELCSRKYTILLNYKIYKKKL